MSDIDQYQIGQSRDLIKKVDKPAIGIIVEKDMTDESVRAILRARHNGYPVIVTPREAPADEVLTFANQLGAQIVASERNADDESLRDKLVYESRRLGYPGLIIHSKLENHIDYDKTILEYSRSDSYVVYAKPKTSTTGIETIVAIPAYNEEKTIKSVISQARSHVDTVLVIDDGSSDGTAHEARKAGATVLEHDQNRGYGGALKSAFQQALRWNVDHLIILDGDGQHDSDDIPKLLARQQETNAEIVVGSRFFPGSNTTLPFYRRVGLGIVNTLVNLGMRRNSSRIRDTQSGFRAYNARAIRSLAQEPIGDHMDASIDVLYHAYHHGYQIEEVATTINYDVDETSSHNPIVHGFILAKSAITAAGSERPIALLAAPSFIAALAGLTLWLFLLLGDAPAALSSPVAVIVSSLTFLVGITICFWAIVRNEVSTN